MRNQHDSEWRVAFTQRRPHHAFFAGEAEARSFARSLERAMFVTAPPIVERWNGFEWCSAPTRTHAHGNQPSGSAAVIAEEVEERANGGDRTEHDEGIGEHHYS